MKKIALVILLFSSGILIGQSNLDSLYSSWLGTEEADSLKDLALYNYGNDGFFQSNPDSAFQFYRTLIDFGKKTKNASAEIEGHLLLSQIYHFQRDFDQSLDHLSTALMISESVGNKKYRSLSLYLSGLTYHAQELNEKALDYLNRSLKINEERNDELAIIWDLARIAQIYIGTGQYDEALEIFFRLLEYDLASGNKRWIAGDYYFIGEVYKLRGQNNLALQYFQKSLEIREGIDYKAGIANCLNYIGDIYLEQANYEQALNYYKSAIRTREQMEVPASRKIGLLLHNIGLAYQNQGHYEQAQAYFNRSLQNSELTGNNEVRAFALLGLGNIYKNQERYDTSMLFLKRSLEICHNREDRKGVARVMNSIGDLYMKKANYHQALKYCSEGSVIAEEIGVINEQVASCECIYKAYKNLGRLAQALVYLEKMNVYRDSLQSEETTRSLREMEYARENLIDSLRAEEQKFERELLFQKEINRQKANRNIGIGIGLVAFLFAIGLFSRLRFVRKTQLILKEKNRQIEAEKEKAEVSEKAKQQFLANMSHEIRTPMNAIKGMTDILLRRGPQDQQLSYLNAIKESSNSLLVIINDILDLSKIEAGKIDLEEIPFSLTEVIQNVETIMHFKAEEKGLQLKTNIQKKEDIQVLGDPTRLHQILLNLTSNAIKFTEKGMVTIQLDVTEVTADQLTARFCVSDTGIGIGKERLEKIFDSFEQAYSDTTRKFGGTGLGLSISKKLVAIQDGKIWAESEKGKGSQFYVTLPFKVDVQQEVGALQEDHSYKADITALLKGTRVLLVEDNIFNAIVAQEELEDAIVKVKVDIAENGAIAVEKVKTAEYDIILMDVQMPVMNGYEATHKIRSLGSKKAKLPIIAMTANVMKEEINRCYEAGMDDFIGKPFETDQLLYKIYQLVKDR